MWIGNSPDLWTSERNHEDQTLKVFFSFRAVLLLVIFFAGSHSSHGAPDTSLCGPKSLQIALKNQGVSSSLNELCSLTRYDPKTGTTMLGLYEAARAKKVPVAAVRITLEELCRSGESKIAFVDGNHFLVVCGCDKDNVTIEDPFTGKHSQARADFQKRWNGETLLFGRSARGALAMRKPEPVFTPKGPRVQFDTILRDFGAVDEGSILTNTFSFRNTGSDTLTVNVRSTCGCTAALLSDKKIPPGGMSRVHMEFKTRDRKGPTSQSIHVRTNDPANQMLTLTMTALIRGSINVIPDRLWLDELFTGASVKREVLVADAGDGMLKVESVRVPKGITARALAPRKDKSGLRVIPVILTVLAEGTGRLEKGITICTNDARRKEIPLPISGIVQARVKAFPPRLFFGEVRPDSIAQREIILSGANGAKIDGVRVTSGSPNITFDVISMENGTKYKVIASLNARKSEITVRDSVSVFLTGSVSPVIDIPLYARVVQ